MRRSDESIALDAAVPTYGNGISEEIRGLRVCGYQFGFFGPFSSVMNEDICGARFLSIVCVVGCANNGEVDAVLVAGEGNRVAEIVTFGSVVAG